MSEFFKKILLEDIDLPGRPDIVVKVLGVLEDEYCSISKLEQVIMDDPSITATILKIANAPLYNTGKSVKTVAESIMSIGLNNALAFVSLAAITNQCLHARCDKDMVHHFLAVSAAASMLSEFAKPLTIEREVAAIAGLLHDVGKPLMFIIMPQEYPKIKNHARKHNKPFIEAEDELLGFNHCNAGSALARKWKLPDIYQGTIKNHHDDTIKKAGLLETDVLCYLVRIADKMVLDAGIGMSISAERQLADLLSVVGIKETDYQNIKEKIEQAGTFEI
jgi:putative nucleotidyltransferase with HDIG domain